MTCSTGSGIWPPRATLATEVEDHQNRNGRTSDHVRRQCERGPQVHTGIVAAPAGPEQLTPEGLLLLEHLLAHLVDLALGVFSHVTLGAGILGHLAGNLVGL